MSHRLRKQNGQQEECRGVGFAIAGATALVGAVLLLSGTASSVTTAGITFLDGAAAVFNSWLLKRGFVGLQQNKTISPGQ
ncbi:MAG: hypothetical protein V7L22_07670 [Nostoc sp.]|uniref:hypothetical protein n=1 Tax=Nostoc sp. TaxID=1180 RepID=UPI002FF555AC